MKILKEKKTALRGKKYSGPTPEQTLPFSIIEMQALFLLVIQICPKTLFII